MKANNESEETRCLPLLSFSGALCFAELGTLIPKSGGEYAYLSKAFGSIPSFLFAWISVVVASPSSFAIASMACANYIMVPFFGDGCGDAPEVYRKMFAVFVVCKFRNIINLQLDQ